MRKGLKTVTDSFVHGTLRLPYRLHIRYKRVHNRLGTTYIFIHGLADTGKLWRPLLERLPKDVNYLVVDLLGHGNSKYPENDAFYSAYRQSINVRFTQLSLGLTGPTVLVGHSFGSLVSAEFAHHYRRTTRQLVLCSPPIYRDPSAGKPLQFQQEKILRELYKRILKKPKSIVRAYDLAAKLKLLGFSRTEISEKKFSGFAGTLRAGIISQYAGKHLAETTVPTTIIYGIADPVIVIGNLTRLAKMNPHISTKPLAGSHAVQEKTLKALLAALT